MKKRALWVGAILTLPLLIISLWHTQWSLAQSPAEGVIINEWSQGNGGSKEWVELLVVEGPVDLRGWDLGDSTPGDLTLSSDALWAQVPQGTRVVIYNGNDPDSSLPSDDADAADCVLILPHNNNAYFSGGWPAFSNSNQDDNPHLRNASDTSVHDYSAEPGEPRPGSGQHVAFRGDTLAAVSTGDNWLLDGADAATPGEGNGAANTAWVTNLCSGTGPTGVDLAVTKTGPATAVAPATLSYNLRVRNLGQASAANVALTDQLPAGLSYVSDDSGLTLRQPAPGTLVWTLGAMPAGADIAFTLTVEAAENVANAVVNEASVVTTSPEENQTNNVATVTTRFAGSNDTAVVLDAVLYDGYENNDADEAVALRNVSAEAVDISSWQIGDGSSATAVIPQGTQLQAGEMLWITRDAAAFARQFGFAPDLVTPTWPGFSNSGDEVVLLDATDDIVDVLVYEGGNTATPGWQGAALQPYTVRGVFGAEGQLLYRQRDQTNGLPVGDTNQASDWAQARNDIINGRKVRYPGWDLDTYFFTTQLTETAELKITIAPDNAFETLKAEIDAAQESIQIETLTFENLGVADALIAAAGRGVAVTVLLEGGPAGGVPEQEKYICQELEAVAAQCWFVISDASADIFDRYRFMHAKFAIIDGTRAIISSENLSPNSLPDDDKQDGTFGRRGVLVVTDAPGIVAHLQGIFQRDFDPTQHVDLLRWQADHPQYGTPETGFIPNREAGGITYTVRYSTPLVLQDTFTFEIVQSPENSLRTQDGLLGLVNRVGPGDTLFVQQLQERPYWGPTDSNPQDDPNPRLEAYLAAARRGADVRLLLDSYFDTASSAVSNTATCAYANGIARAERLRLSCTLGNPTGLGIHNKMVLASINGRGYVHVGSLNGTEQASKGNRELALQFQSDAAYALLADMFARDNLQGVLLPVVASNFQGAARHVLISEVLYDPPGPDEAEFIELVNPTTTAVNLGGYGIGDALNRDDFEDVRRFPPGTLLQPRQTLVIATSAAAFFQSYTRLPDFEILDTEPTVPELSDDPDWGDTKALLQLGNAGDEVILRDTADNIVDALAYGTGMVPGHVSCPLVAATNHSLERVPYWRDTNDCTLDFRDWPFPSPGRLP